MTGDDVDKWLHSPLVAGVVGAAVGLRFVPGLTWVARLAHVAAGSLTAAYMAPAVAEGLSVHNQATLGALAFVFGLLGMSLASAMLEGIKRLPIAQILQSWLERKG